MAELVIARIDESGIRARDLSETKSAKNEITLIGHQADKGGVASISRNGLTIPIVNTKGLNCVNLSESGLVLANSVFDFSQANATTNFITWLDACTTGIVLMVSHTEIITDTTLTNKFKSIGCDSWEYYWKAGATARSSFAGIYDATLKKMMTFQFVGNDTSIDPATIVVQYDTFADIGSTGYGYPVVWEESEVISGSNDYPSNQYLPVTKLSSLGLSVGETIGVYAELFQDSVTVSAGSHASIIVQFYLDGVWKNSFELSGGTVANDWDGKTMELQIPAGVNEMSVGLYRFPKLTSSTGKVGARDLVVKPKKPEQIKTTQQHGGFGQWGFITSGASEKSVFPTIGTSGEDQELDAYRYGLLTENTFGRLFGNGYFKIPKWYPGTNFEMEQEIIWDVGNTLMMLSGQYDKMFVGVRTEFDPNNADNVEGHIFSCGGVNYRHAEKIRYGETYTYKIKVVNTTVTFYLNGEQVCTGVMSSPIGVLDSFFVGGVGSAGSFVSDKGCYGVPIGLRFTDNLDKSNGRYYNFVMAGSTNSMNQIRGRSPMSGLEYQTESFCTSSTSLMYSGIGSGAMPYGSQSGDYCYVTVLEVGSATLSNPSWLGNRYPCQVVANAGSTTKQNEFNILNPDGGSSWITAGNMSTVKVRVEYTANPPMDADQVNVTWITSETKGPLFDGTTWVDIPAVSTPMDYVVKVIRTAASTGDQYILDGRTNVNTTNGYLIVDSSGRLTLTNENSVAGDFTIDSVNGESFMPGVYIELNKPYVIAGRAPRMARIGARYDGAQGFKGRIWDLNLENAQTKELMYWPGIHTTPMVSNSNGYIEESKTPLCVYHTVDVTQLTKHANVSIVSRNKVSFTATGVSTGLAGSFGLAKGDRFRVMFDITSDVPVDLICADVFDDAAPIMKSLPAGRNVGVLSYQHVAGVSGPGVYIRANSPVIGSVIQINRFDVFRGVLDGVCNKTSTTSVFTAFTKPNIKIQTKKLWCPAFGTGFIDIPSWKPDPANFRIHIKAVVGTPSSVANTILSGPNESVSGIYIDTHTDSKRVRVFGYNGSGVMHSLIDVAHPASVGSLIDIDVVVLTTHDSQGNLVTDREMTLTVKGDNFEGSGVGTWAGDGTETVKYIGYRPTLYRYNSDIQRVDLIDSGCQRWNTRQYDLTRVQNSQPNNLLLQYNLEFTKLIKIGQGVGYNGWNNTIYPQVGFFKDTHYIDGQKLIYIKSSNSSLNDIRLKFEGGKQPFGYISIELWDTKVGSINNELEIVDTFDLTPVGSDAAGTVEYVSSVRASLPDWWSDVNAYKKIVLRPLGVGSNVVLTNFTGNIWRETVY